MTMTLIANMEIVLGAGQHLIVGWCDCIDLVAG